MHERACAEDDEAKRGGRGITLEQIIRSYAMALFGSMYQEGGLQDDEMLQPIRHTQRSGPSECGAMFQDDETRHDYQRMDRMLLEGRGKTGG